MSFQNNNAVDTYQDFMLPTALDSDFSSEDLADDMDGLQLTMQRVKIPGGGNLQFAFRLIPVSHYKTVFYRHRHFI